MNEYLIPALTVALPSIGFIAGALFAGGKNQSLRERVASRDAALTAWKGAYRSLRIEYEAFRVGRTKSNVNLLEANAKRSAKAAEKIAEDTAARHLRMEAAEQRSAMKVAAE